jgi:hypothetical protein
MLAVRASSLASQLLQVCWVLPGIASGGDHLVGAGLPAKAVCQARKMLAVRASSLASQLLQFELTPKCWTVFVASQRIGFCIPQDSVRQVLP